MALKTPVHIDAKIQIERADTQEVITRNINLTAIIEDAIVAHVANLFQVSNTEALSRIERWRVQDIRFDRGTE